MTEGSVPAERLERIERAIEAVPYAQLLGIELEKVLLGEATLTLAFRPELSQNHGVVHGGAIASLIDTATAFAILTLLEPEERVTTVDLTISYLRPGLEGQMRATARVLRQGRRLIATSAEVTNEGGTLLATALSTYIKL
ncbi:MAG TPA: ABC transporter substrate-binding protein [Blastocatellia bacterium]|nr:ABC transporter substrate-binding protein [Blastocatellia bacterium]